MNSGLVGALGTAPLQTKKASILPLKNLFASRSSLSPVFGTRPDNPILSLHEDRGNPDFFGTNPSPGDGISNTVRIGSNAQLLFGSGQFIPNFTGTPTGRAGMYLRSNGSVFVITNKALYTGSIEFVLSNDNPATRYKLTQGSSTWYGGGNVPSDTLFLNEAGLYISAGGNFNTSGTRRNSSCASNMIALVSSDTLTELFLTSFNNGLNVFRYSIASGVVAFLDILITAATTGGISVNNYKRRIGVKNTLGTTQQISDLETIGTDYTNLPSLDFSITADDSLDALRIYGKGLPQFNATGLASTDIINCPGHNFVNGDDVSWVSITGGSPFTTTAQYWVINVNGDDFQVSTTRGGNAVNFTSNITAGVITRKTIWHAHIVGTSTTALL